MVLRSEFLEVLLSSVCIFLKPKKVSNKSKENRKKKQQTAAVQR